VETGDPARPEGRGSGFIQFENSYAAEQFQVAIE
jgi:hypothetical protein